MGDAVRAYLSFGAGVNSTALMVLLREKGLPFEAVFADTGCEWPETYEHIVWLQSHGWPITVLPGTQDGLSLLEYCQKYLFLPSPFMRWCTQKHKVKPLHASFVRPCTVYIGIDYGEAHRVKSSRDNGIENEHPLVDWGIGRRECVETIKRAGIPVPPKSGCWLCPFASVGRIRLLRDEHPELYCQVQQLEKAQVERQVSKGLKPFYLYKKPIDEVVKEGQMEMFGLRKPCMCGL